MFTMKKKENINFVTDHLLEPLTFLKPILDLISVERHGPAVSVEANYSMGPKFEGYTYDML